MDETPGVVLAVYAHPDDADVGCGGTLARWAKAGSAVHLVVCTDGGKGTTDPDVVPARLAVERAGELEASSALIGLSSVDNLGFPDGELADSDDFRRTLVRRVRGSPDVVCGHDPTAVFFGRDYFNHRDHRIAGAALLDAVAPASGLPHYFPDGPAHRVSTVLLSAPSSPTSGSTSPTPSRPRRLPSSATGASSPARAAGPARRCGVAPPRRAGGSAPPTPRVSAG